MRDALVFDDAWFLGYCQHCFRLTCTLCRDKLEKMARGAALTITGNEYLAPRGPRERRPERVVAADRGWPRPLSVASAAGRTIDHRMDRDAGHRPYLAHIADRLCRLCRDGRAQLVVAAEKFVLDGVPIVHAPRGEQTEAELL